MRLAILAAAAVVAAATMAPARAGEGDGDGPSFHVPCFPHAAVAEKLGKEFGERSIGSGTASSGRYMVEIFLNRENRSWSLLMHLTDGRSCMIAAGDDWNEAQR